jgi:glycerophosphoryl diester phosphodiesterase
LYACDSTLIIAHRGASGLAPQNTLSAFQLAIDIGADYIELDVRKSLDDSLMVIHDATVNATTNGTGNVSNKSYAELKSLDAGSWFGPTFIGEQIPSLHEVLALAKLNGVKVCVEIKQSGLETSVISMIQSLNMLDDVIIFSFSLSELQTIKLMVPSIRVCFLDVLISPTDISNLNNIGGEFVGCGIIPLMDDIEFARGLGVGYFAWTVNDPDQMQKLMSKGISGIITNDPHEMVGLKSFMGIGNGGLVAYWDFDEGSGATINDSSGNNNTGTMSGGTWGTGYYQSALEFNGTSSYVNIPISSSLDIGGSAVSISSWLKLDILPTVMPGNFGPIFDSDQDSYILYLDKSNAELRFKVKDNDIDVERPGIPESLLSTGNWIHVVGVYNGDEAMIYLNGELVDYHINVFLDNLLTGQVPQLGQNGGFYYDGSIDELKIYDRALSRDEVRSIYQGHFLLCTEQASETVELSTLGLSNIADTTVCDSTQLTYQIGAIPRITYEYDGVADYVNVNSVIPHLAGGSHSFFGWFKTTNPTSDERIFAINGNPSSNSNISLFGIYNGLVDVYNGSYYSGTTLVNDGNWHFLGYSWNQATQQLQLWVDGVLDGNFTTDLTVATTDRGSLGQEFDGLSISNQYNGSMAEITIWNDVLSGPQVSQLMLNPVTSSNPQYLNLVGYYNTISGCEWELKDRSSYNNNGITCSKIEHNHEVIPSFNNSDISFLWVSDALGVLSTSTTVNFMANVSQELVFTGNNGYGTTYTDELYITVDDCLGSNNNNAFGNRIIAYPNPSNDMVTIQLDGYYSIVNVEIFGIYGNLISSAVYQNQDSLDLKINGESGCYFVKIETDDSKIATIKLLKE